MSPILNTNEILCAIQPEDPNRFLRWLWAKIEQVLKFPLIMPYEANTIHGHLKIISSEKILINNIEVKI